MLTPDGLSQWTEVQSGMQSSGGALHLRQDVVKSMSDEQQSLLATRSAKYGVSLSLEIGGIMCEGNGEGQGEKQMGHYEAFIENGGEFKFIALESVFSRTSKAARPGGDCEGQSLETTAKETALFAKAIAQRWPNAVFILYDALPHFHVGDFPASNTKFDMELIDAIKLLRKAMTTQGLDLAGYWMDSPYEASLLIPHGWDKIAEAVRQVKAEHLQVGKTFNSGDGGKESNQKFYTQTMADFHRTIEKAPISSFDFAMVETWFHFPDSTLPETEPWTTAYTTREVFREILNEHVMV